MPKKKNELLEPYFKAFGKRLNELVKDKESFAEAIGVSLSMVYKYTRGETAPTYQVVIKIHQYLPDVDIHWLLLGDEKERLRNMKGYSEREVEMMEDFVLTQKRLISELESKIQLLEKENSKLKSLANND
jgi:transcriptional regulator with XRE-family HTH domain